MELCLGTVQFGMDYGIQGGKKPVKSDVFQMLDFAGNHNIRLLDTAAGYGDAQTTLGEYLCSHPGSFDVITKLPRDLFQNLSGPEDYQTVAFSETEAILEKLFLPKLAGLLFHNPEHLYDENAVAVLKDLKRFGYTERIGVSVYEPKDAFYALELQMDLIQLPVNLFDHRFDEVIERAGNSVRIFARSVYLQGLLLMDTDKVSTKLPKATPYIKKLDQLCKSVGYQRQEVAMAYLKEKIGVHAIVFGVDSLKQLKGNINSFHKQIPFEVITEIAQHFEQIDENIVSPLLWGMQ